MSTRSNIVRENPDGSFDSIYCHWDGYPDNNGRILYEHYQDQQKVDALIALGNLSSLGAALGEQHNFERRPDDQCNAYGRDRGESDTEAQHFATAEDLAAMLKKAWTEWVYVWRVTEGAGGKWYYTNNASPTWFKCCGDQREESELTPAAWTEVSEEGLTAALTVKPVWTPAAVGCYWTREGCTISTVSCGPDSYYQLTRDFTDMGHFPTLEDAQRAGDLLIEAVADEAVPGGR